jgi:large subunit ribosomal protein L24e
VKAIERIEEIKQRRQNQFIMNRLQVGTEDRTEADLKEVKDFMHLIKAPHGLLLNYLNFTNLKNGV